LRTALSLAAVALALTLLSACGDDADAGEEKVQGVGEVLVGSVAPLAQCRDWNAGDEEQRIATIEDIRSQINLEDAPVQAPALSNERAAELFDDACKPTYAAGFRLYKLYARAAAFSPLEDVTGEAE
jgi:hypothetical protein